MTNVYLFPGQGSDYRMFQNLKLDSDFETITIIYPVPEKGVSMRDYALTLTDQIDTANPYIFIGVSLGGMICSELNEIYHPQKTILISSAKNRSELPGRYRFMKYLPLYKLIPANLMKACAFLVQPVVEPDRRNGKDTFISMLKAKDPKFIKRTTDMIVKWEKKETGEDIVQIHGTRDHTIPIGKINADYSINKGSHMMTFTRGAELSLLINRILTGSEQNVTSTRAGNN